ncbi:MAG: efflux RND transporter permease subunit [Phycisphaerae bacterium]|nr:efflux RND transporter permease subunit [Phycisphaerae bacterium]
MTDPSEKAPLPGAQDTHHGDGFVIRHRKGILFVSLVVCLAGAYSAYRMPASVFPQTDFPRVVILLDNGVMPADEMMATITRPIEEAMKNIPGAVNIRSATGRGSAEVNVFFDWKTDMVQAELYVLGRLSQIRSTLPATTEAAVHRLTFAAFPVIGISMTSDRRGVTDLWEMARYDIQPRFLRIPGVARIALVGGSVPEYHVVLDPLKLEAFRLTPQQVTDAIVQANRFVPAGMHEEDRQLYLTLVDGRAAGADELADMVIGWAGASPIHVCDVGSVRRGAAPRFNIVTADGVDAVLLNVYSQPDGNTVAIADTLQTELRNLKRELPPDIRMAFFYDQSQFVREGVGSVWEAIFIGLALSIVVLYAFLRTVSTTLVAVLAIPVTVLSTLVGMHLFHMSFNLMTLGGIAAAIGLVIDDAIVVVEAMYAKVCAGHTRIAAARLAVHEVGLPLVGSTLTPVVVFIPLAYLTGVPGVFFRALALTMVFALLSSLLIAVTLTPTLGAALMRRRGGPAQDELEQGGPMLRRLIAAYEWAARRILHHPKVAMVCVALIVAAGVGMYTSLESDFLPEQDEGAFVLDYFSRPGTSLAETDRMLRHVEEILYDTPEIESYSRRTGARLALAIAEPNTGDFLVKLKKGRARTTEEVIDELREKIQAAEPALNTEFPGVLGDLIGDLTWSPDPIEIKIFTNDTDQLKRLASKIAEEIEQVPGVVDVNDGLVVAGPSLRYQVRQAVAARAGLDAAQIGANLESAMLGSPASYILEGDRTKPVRVLLEHQQIADRRRIGEMPVRSLQGTRLTLDDVAQANVYPGRLERHREDLRELIAVSGRFSGRDLGSGIAAIKEHLAESLQIPLGVSIEYGGLYQQQQESFRNLLNVLIMAILLVYGVLLLEFRAVLHPLAIVGGAVLALFGVLVALWVTNTSLNIVSFLGAIIGVGIVAKNGILMLDYVDHLRRRGLPLVEALVQSGRRRLRPVLMTSMTTFLGLLPLAYGVGAGADMLRPLAIAVIGSLCISLVLSLLATPLFYYVFLRVLGLHEHRPTAGPTMLEAGA